MRKLAVIALACILALAVIPASFAQVRLDIGAIVPRGAGITVGGSSTTTSLGDTVTNWPFIPLPDAGIYYQGVVGPLKLGVGARAFTLIVETIAWPNAFAELELDRLAIEAQVGGGAVLLLGILPSQAHFGNYLVPDISIWYELGKKKSFRLGGGLIGLYLPEVLGDAVPFLFYLGGKAAITF